MPRTHFEQALSDLHRRVVDMSLAAERALDAAMIAMKNRDEALARQVIAGDDAVDATEVDIEKACISLLARQQPLAQDLRQVMAVLKMTTDIERIADQAADISELMLPCLSAMNLEPPASIYEMAEHASTMVHDAIHAYVHQDEPLANAVIERDEIVDALFEKSSALLADAMRAHTDSIELAMKLAYVAKYLERVADHATNIAEWALYRITGDIIIS